ncbi:hypothetical protein HR060_01685 [Catenovulum sp. SM1970]|uniref:hypothetical protein n=1 Tax=Marinifaba aquimaris TaxID=2741323 RepID=UPI00157244ED|nr:hypothetical protein [Marinifaba aquimaris]NTS75565.1 hypothetical protein [Marinifaba aquimaris]
MQKLLIALTLLGFSCVLQAKNLTGNDVEKWIKAFPQAEQWLTANADKLSTESIDFLNNSPEKVVEVAMAQIKSSGLYASFANQLQQYGFTPEQFISTQVKVLQAMMSLNVPTDAGMLSNQMSDTLKQLEANEQLTAEEKAMMKKQMQQMMTLTQGFNKQQQSPDVAVIEQYKSQIQGLFQ